MDNTPQNKELNELEKKLEADALKLQNYLFKKGRVKTGGRKKGTLNKSTILRNQSLAKNYNKIDEVASLILDKIKKSEELKRQSSFDPFGETLSNKETKAQLSLVIKLLQRNNF